MPIKIAVETTNTENLEGADLISKLVERQDEVLDELDRLNDQIETMINELSAARKSEAA